MKNLSQAPAIIRKIFGHTAMVSLIIISIVTLYSVYLVQQSSTVPPDEAYILELQTKNSFGRFDQATIDKIERLQAPDDTAAADLPSGRINPFKPQ